MNAAKPAHVGIEPENWRECDLIVVRLRGRCCGLAFPGPQMRGTGDTLCLPFPFISCGGRRICSRRRRGRCRYSRTGVRRYKFACGAGASQQQNLDTRGNTPGFFTLEAERGEGMSKRLAQAQTIEEIERGVFRLRGLRFSSVDGFGEPLEPTPGEHRTPHFGCCDLGTWARQHAPRGSRPRGREERFHGRHLHGGAEQPVEAQAPATPDRPTARWARARRPA